MRCHHKRKCLTLAQHLGLQGSSLHILDVNPTVPPSPKSLPNSIEKAVSYLRKRLPTVTNPYAVAMTSYALANENKLERSILYKFASPGLVNTASVPFGGSAQ